MAAAGRACQGRIQVRAAATLAEARACLAEAGPKVLLTDLQLPDGHGVDLIREARARFER
jgi:DNA-binding response OmpR family regulator